MFLVWDWQVKNVHVRSGLFQDIKQHILYCTMYIFEKINFTNLFYFQFHYFNLKSKLGLDLTFWFLLN